MMNKRKFIKNENGITLTILAITIVILMLLAGVSLLIFEKTDVIGHTEESVNTYHNDKQVIANEVDQMTTRLDNSNIKLSQTQVELIRNKIKTGNLYTVNYEPQTVNETVTVDGSYNGGLENQTFNQTDTGAKGANKMSWYVLSADVNQVNLVSSVSNKQIAFKDAGGYDNCLYFLNEIAQKLFLNQELGVNATDVHAFRLTDIKTAAEQVNGSGYDFTETFVKGAIYKSTNFMEKQSINNIRYPGLYTANAEKKVAIDSNIYDEEIGNLITNDDGISRILSDNSNPADSVTAAGTWFGYKDNSSKMIQNLGAFGNTTIAGEIFLAQPYYLATRFIHTKSGGFSYGIKSVRLDGTMHGWDFCVSNGSIEQHNENFRIVVSIPASHVNVGEDGTITLKS